MGLENVGGINEVPQINVQNEGVKKAPSPKVDLNDPVDTIEIKNDAKPKKKKGAKIGALIASGVAGINLLRNRKDLISLSKEYIKTLGKTKGIAIFASGFGIAMAAVAGLGAGIGAIADKISGNKS